MYTIRMQVFSSENLETFEEWHGKFNFDTKSECIPKIKGYVKEVKTGRKMALSGCHDQYWSGCCGREYLSGSGQLILVALPLSTKDVPILCQVGAIKESFTTGTWSYLDMTKKGVVEISIEESKVYGPERGAEDEAVNRKYKQMLNNLPEVYHNLCRCLNFTRTYEF
ncbi:MAG: hypothetical protein HFJ28_04965 [Clostridia bacterium]|nr:hypothetical protein [Clostridia bacterium]